VISTVHTLKVNLHLTKSLLASAVSVNCLQKIEAT